MYEAILQQFLAGRDIDMGGGKTTRLDANESAIISNQLEHVKAKIYEAKYPNFKARTLMPVENDTPPGTQTVTFTMMDWVGAGAKGHANGANDNPLVEVVMKKESIGVKTIKKAFTYSVQDLARAAKSGVPLDQLRGRAARRAIETDLERIAALGDSTLNVKGLYNQTGPTVAAATGAWSGLTSDQILADLNAMANGIVNDTGEAIIPDTIVLPVTQYSLINSKRASADADGTVLKFFLNNNPYIKNVVPWVYGATAGVGSVARAVCFAKDPEIISLEMVQELQTLAPQARDLDLIVNMYMETAGVYLKQAKGLRYTDGL